MYSLTTSTIIKKKLPQVELKSYDYKPGNIKASAVVFASANVTLPRSRPWPHACAAEVRGPGCTREGAAAPSLVRPDLGQTREGAQAPSLVLKNCLIKVMP